MSYKDPVPGFRATPTQEDLISDLHSVGSAETWFLKKPHLQLLGGQDVELIQLIRASLGGSVIKNLSAIQET